MEKNEEEKKRNKNNKEEQHLLLVLVLLLAMLAVLLDKFHWHLDIQYLHSFSSCVGSGPSIASAKVKAVNMPTINLSVWEEYCW